jgi:hypothetical protein
MKKFLIFILIPLITAAWVSADVYIKQKVHTDAYYYGGITNPAVDSVNEIWIGKKKMALLTRDLVTIIDMENNRAFILHKIDKTYIETALPPDLPQLVPENLVGTAQALQYQGTVTGTGKTRTIEKWKCKEYQINAYLSYSNSRRNETDSTAWVSSKIPFDLDTYQAMNVMLQRSKNYSKAFIQELKKIKGFVIASESYFYPKGFGVKTTETVVEMSRKDAPEGIYSVPAGYTKNEKIPRRLLFKLLGF